MSDKHQQNPTKKRVVNSSPVDHSYHDYANIPIQNPRLSNSAVSTARCQNFPAKLHQIVSTPGYRHIIVWLPHGRSWTIRNKELFISIVLKEHFRHGSFESFNRQVNLWGFKRLYRAGPDYKSYYHEAFLRGRPDLTYLLRRLRNEGKRIPDLSTEPNFYQMTFLPSVRLPSSDRLSAAIMGENIGAHSRVSVSSSSKLGGHSASDCQLERSAFASHSEKYPDSTTHSQQLHELFHHSTSSTLCSFPTSSGIGVTSSHASDIYENSVDDRHRFSDRHCRTEPFQLKEDGNLNEGSSKYSLMKIAPEFLSASVRSKAYGPPEECVSETLHSAEEKCYHECYVNKQSASQIHPKTCKGMDVSSAVTMLGSSYSSGYLTPHGSTYSSSSRQNDNESNIGVISNVRAASRHHQSDNTNMASDISEAGAQSTTALRTVTLAHQSIALLSSPPNDPVLEEFAREYLPHFGKEDHNHR